MDNRTFIDKIAERTGRTREEISDLTESLRVIVAEAIKDGDIVAIPSVGTFETKLRGDRITIHPASGKKMLIPPKLTINFKPSSLLKQKIR
ncbi:MAG: HU family DNA-binding protein [Muribaculaceae bacterium]|nr:HU family DNA-binding protein [Muribaculaceae bacterium]